LFCGGEEGDGHGEDCGHYNFRTCRLICPRRCLTGQRFWGDP
jgi:hypothetical protein